MSEPTRSARRRKAADRAHRRPQDLQAVHRRSVPALGVGSLVRGERQSRPLSRQRRVGLTQGRARCRCRRPQGVCRLVRRHRVQPGPGALPGSRAHGGPALAVRRRGSRRRGHHPPARRSGRECRGGPVGLVRRLGGQDRPGGRQHEPGGRAVLRLLPARADRRSSRCSRRSSSSLLGLVSVLAPVIVSGNTAVLVLVRPIDRCRRSRSARCWRRPTFPGGVVNVLTGRAAEIGPWLASHMDVNAIDLTGVAGRRRASSGARGRCRGQPQAGDSARPTPSRTGRRHPARSGSPHISSSRRSGTRSACSRSGPWTRSSARYVEREPSCSSDDVSSSADGNVSVESTGCSLAAASQIAGSARRLGWRVRRSRARPQPVPRSPRRGAPAPPARPTTTPPVRAAGRRKPAGRTACWLARTAAGPGRTAGPAGRCRTGRLRTGPRRTGPSPYCVDP